MKIDISQLDFIHANLRIMCLYLEDEIGVEFTITSLYRIGDPGVHGQLPLRGIDLRMHDREVGEAVEDLINKNFKYDNLRPALKCAVLHGDNLHLHLQAHDDTRRVYEK